MKNSTKITSVNTLGTSCIIANYFKNWKLVGRGLLKKVKTVTGFKKSSACIKFTDIKNSTNTISVTNLRKYVSKILVTIWECKTLECKSLL